MKLTSIQAEWKKLLLYNYRVDPDILKPYLPYKTQLAQWDGACFISLVGFLFLKVRLAGIPIPLHTNFVEINLRFYVMREYGDEWRYGVVFLKEIVTLPMVALIANKIAREHYDVMLTKHQIQRTPDNLYVHYGWKKKEWNTMEINCEPSLIPIVENSPEDFFTAQHWGYSKVNVHKTYEYAVVHPKWKMYRTKDFSSSIDFAKVFGDPFGFLKEQEPHSVFLAEGSPIEMTKMKTIRKKDA